MKFHSTYDGLPRKTDRHDVICVVVADLETTGLSHDTDQVIELAYRKCWVVADTGEVVASRAGFSQLRQPTVEISKKITTLTGITNEMVSGQSVDWKSFEADMAGVDIVIAHNAAFDRPFIDAECPTLKNILWGCSKAHIDWVSEGYSDKLELLSAQCGLFTGAHRALNDVDILLHIITSKGLFKTLWANASKPIYKSEISTRGDQKDLVKPRGYRWDGDNKFWWKIIDESSAQAEADWAKSVGLNGVLKKLLPGMQFARTK